jgi:hypothetical protein
MRHKCLLVRVGVGVAFLLAQPSTVSAQAGPNLVITMSHTGNFTVGVPGVYTIVVSNTGGTASSGQIQVDDESLQDTMFTTVSASGTGWSCSVHFPTFSTVDIVTCTSSSVIAPGGSAFPIALTVLPYVSGTFTNTASLDNVGGGTSFGPPASDPTIIVAAVPTLPQWAMMALSVLLVLTGVAALRRRTA